MLYTKDKSEKTRYWNISVDVEGDSVFITKRFGQVDGKETVTRTEIKSGKNIGKKNETTKIQQANLEMASLLKKHKDAGYVEDLAALDKRILILPMLANKWDDKSHYIKEPFYVQPKLDGVRMLIGVHEGKFVILSRTGKSIKHMDHIGDELKLHLSEGEFLDGESYNHDITFEEITGMCRTSLKKSAESKDLNKIQFHVFDFFNLNKLEETFEERNNNLKTFFKKSFKNIHIVPSKIVNDKTLVHSLHDDYVKDGYEGIMMRDPSSKYLLSERSNHLLKYKAFQTDEYKIVSAREARGRDAETVVWVCITGKGQEFSVRPRGTLQQRKDWLRSKHRYYGNMLTVQYQNLTPDGIPRFPVGLAIRDYE